MTVRAARNVLLTHTLNDTILKDLKTREEEESNKIRQLLKSLNDKEKDITEYQTNIANIKQYASDLLTFLALKHIEKDVAVDEAYIQSVVKNLGANQIDFSCKINPSLQDLISTVQKFGDVVVTADPCNVLILKHKDKQAQMMVAVTPITIDSLNPTLLQTLDTKLTCVTGCSFLPDCRMIFSCAIEQMIRVYKPDGSLDFHIGNLCPVFDVTHIIAENAIALTSGYLEDSLQINLIDLKTRKVKKTLKINAVNSGIAYSEDKLIYCAGEKGIQMINLNDESIVNITKTKMSSWSYVACFGEKIFYTDCNDGSVTCIDFQGNIQWVFENKMVLRNPFGISVDGDGNVYVVGSNRNNVIVISPNGQNIRQLLTSKNGLKSPIAIHVDRSNYKMLVANSGKQAFLYDLK
ncbi:uncharacterized protein [Mytilus edulis]|uniref:uncharacterized protein n=1 Tax=Mytilus edulis TaxID=6550 RepID=UPI0039EF3FD3